MRLLIVLALVACGKDAKTEAPLTKASCHTAVSMTCEDYDSTSPAYFKNRQRDCKEIGGAWATQACATAGLLGSCRETQASWTRTRHYYVGTPADLGRMKIECGAYGQWLEPSAPR